VFDSRPTWLLGLLARSTHRGLRSHHFRTMTSSSTVRAVGPAMASPSFPDPVFHPIRRIHGLVETPHNDDDDQGTGANPDGSERPPSLMRSHSVRGNVLLLEHPQEGTKAFLLQRKVGTSAYGGSARIGFCLQGDKPGKDGLWHVIPKQSTNPLMTTTTMTTATRDEETRTESASRKRNHAMLEEVKEQYEMVTIYIESEISLDGTDGTSSSFTPAKDNLKTELSALQWIEQQSKTQYHLDHLWGSSYMGKENGSICVVLSPWHSDGTLLDHVTSQPNGVLGLEDAKFFFKQIVQVRGMYGNLIYVITGTSVCNAARDFAFLCIQFLIGPTYPG